MALNELGFGMMRLPLNSSEPTDFNYEELNNMTDAFLDAGFNYFDTSYVYHKGESQIAVRKTLVERYPRDKYRVATKFPTFALQKEEDAESIFQSQLDALGVDYIDYYLLHTLQNFLYDGSDGRSGGIVKQAHLFEHQKQWKKEGRIRKMGFSHHSSAENLDRILTENPEVDFVQIVINYFDWESSLVRSKDCYDVIRKHGKEVLIMEPVKGGSLSNLPPEADKLLKDMNPDVSSASWAMRFAGGLDGTTAVLSGMSNMQQMEDNIQIMKTMKELSNKEKDVLKQVVRIMKENGPLKTADFSKYAGIKYHGVPVSIILDTYNTILAQFNPNIVCENSYYRNAVIEAIGRDFKADPFTDNTPVLLPDGTDITEMVKTAEDYLISHAF